MWIARALRSLVVVGFAVLLMGQAKNCGDLSSIIPQLDNLFAQGQKGSKIYIANLSFLDATTHSTMAAGDTDLINTAVEEGMKTLANQDHKYVVNEPGHTIVNNDANANKLSTIFWDPNMTPTEKVDKIINELMTPNGVDGLVAGQFIQNADGSVNLRPFVISKSTKKLVTETRTFKKDEFQCKDPSNPNKNVLCDKTVEDIRDTVIRLLKQL
ncbi:MAG TPA: hypothetical protein VN838_31655 [Bradyrhizobium sp.]|nr:hypothetical protein [Bradyrhizobium sp.]